MVSGCTHIYIYYGARPTHHDFTEAMTIREAVPLSAYTTFRTGGPADFFIEIESIDELEEALEWAQQKNLPFFILGGGSNILVSDEGFRGVVIKNNCKGISFNDRDNEVEVVAGAGEEWDAFVEKTVEAGLTGLENLSLIPGTVGASPVQNIGAYGVEAKDTIAWVEVYDFTQNEIRTLSHTECEFEYRSSIFKRPEYKHLVILHVAYKLSKNKKPNSSYKDVARYFEERGITNPSARDIRNAVIEIRTKKLPSIHEYGTAGSFFKNPIISKERFENLKALYPELPSFPAGEEVKVPLAWILDNVCGVRGLQKGNVATYKNQALVIVHNGNATSQEIKNFADELILLVKEKTEINVVSEVEYVGTFL